jgi:hypothetical protein
MRGPGPDLTHWPNTLYLKVRTSQALRLQEHFVYFAADFVRCAALWLASQQPQATSINTKSVKHMMQVCAHTSA